MAIASIFDEVTYSFCSQIYDLFIIPREITTEELEHVKMHITDLDNFEVLQTGDLSGTTYLYFRCMCNTDLSISPKVENHGGIVQEPLEYREGWEWYRVICLNEKTQKTVLEFIQQLSNYKIVSIRDLGRDGIFKSQFVSIHQLMKMMTDRQIEVLVEAYNQGYYEIPRNTTTQQIADVFDVSRTATEKSLRKAENSVMKLMMPFLIFHQRVHNNKDMQTRQIKPVKLF